MAEYLVYWYHLAEHTDPFSQGYIGVTMQNDIRKRCHVNGLRGGSKILNSAYKKYGEANILQDVLHSVADKSQAYSLELSYRPEVKIGWNIAIGGGLPPDTTGRIDSQEIRDKRTESVRNAKAGKTYPSVFKGMTDRHSEERRQTIGNQQRGKTISEAHRASASEKLSGDNNPKAKPIFIVHKDSPEKVYRFMCIKVAANTLGIPYNTLRSQAKRTIKHNRTSEPSRTGWICLSEADSQSPVDAVKLTIATRNARFKQMAIERESNKLKGIGVTPDINN